MGFTISTFILLRASIELEILFVPNLRLKTDAIPNSFARRAKIKFRKWLFRRKNNSPYISGDSFASLADLRIESTDYDFSQISLPVSAIKVIFIRGDLLEEFLTRSVIFPNQVVIISGNSDQNFSNDLALPEWVAHLFCQNYAGPVNSKITTIPIGLENLSLGRNGLPGLFKFEPYAKKKTDKILLPPMAPTNKTRVLVKSKASANSDFFDVYSEYLLEKEYLDLVHGYQFIFCCEGNGFDSHRVWETLYSGSFPVVLRTSWSSKFENLGLPILFLDDLGNISDNLLEDFLDRFKDFNPQCVDYLWIPYWIDKIEKYSTY